MDKENLGVCRTFVSFRLWGGVQESGWESICLANKKAWFEKIASRPRQKHTETLYKQAETHVNTYKHLVNTYKNLAKTNKNLVKTYKHLSKTYKEAFVSVSGSTLIKKCWECFVHLFRFGCGGSKKAAGRAFAWKIKRPDSKKTPRAPDKNI